LQGDASKARDALGWKPKVGFGELVKMMVDSDLLLAEAEERSGLHAHRSREG
jgi:GDPmannose 4,6-dehydratase